MRVPVPFRLAALCVSCWPAFAHAEIDGHGPDSWKVHDVSSGDVLNARIGPGTNFPVIDSFLNDERGLQQITCVPLLIDGVAAKLTQAQRDALPPRWCLMRSADLLRAGWVSQRYLIGESYTPVEQSEMPGNDATIVEAVNLVRALYENADRASSRDSHPLDPANAMDYFAADLVKKMQSQPLQADPLFGAQDFDGHYSAPVPDPEQTMFRGMISINVEIVNFGQPHVAVFRLRADPGQPGAPIRIFRVEHEGWSFP